ncbi:MAG: LacI family DNA-binding transcriptional regulator [Ignavibacteriae bacterium]|nr:LacI family DNA-binding transcriptional regulator [Ignavibacteriota bacterium]MCB9207078.1 LacI family DNA-binding transcriptional regulator [Ignavibacteriales bacterium]MCB9211170.1 LacI family DNA-binding transcriptional regulator [Ignavibacteriales bacterium]MCB9219467.1 LacI family DNA-binding transcriptional regulator [Ignavibacteriales bacterium]MCB9259859.1 LacI family DNA-binding transcriptional regulator [Ignavibacteriales bacterium]
MVNKSVRLSDIAERLNVSTVTVSKALRNHPDISPQTKKIISDVAAEMGYTPNFMARNLSSRKSNTIGIVVPKIAHFFFGSIIESIYNIAFKNNYEIILTVSQEDAEIERKHIQTLLSMRVDGIIISITQETKDYSIFETVKSRGVPIVFMDRIPQIPNIDTVFVDDRGGAFKAVEHAIKLGYKKIAHFAGYTEINIGQLRYLGFEDAMKKYNLPVNKDWVCRGGFGEKYGYESFMKLYRENNLPDLIFTVTYPVALGIYMAASELNLKIPNDIDVICFGDAKVQKFLSPPLSCITQPTNLIAEKSMEILLEKINKTEEITYKSIEIPTELMLRGTCINFNKKK